MQKDDFSKELPEQCKCDVCRKPLPVQWDIRRYGALEWMGIGLAKCSRCDWLKVAATGSDEFSYRQAQNVRLRLVVQLGL